MPLSISSSNVNARLPKGKWLTTWLITIIICITITLGWEGYCRTIGFTPDGVADTPDLWLKTRKRASMLGNDAVILVGASRIQLGINTDVMSHYTPTRPVQLAIDGSILIPVLENLANDDSITGTIIVDLEVEKINPRLKEKRTENIVKYYEDYKTIQPYGALQPVEEFLQAQVNRLFAFRITGANPQTLFSRLFVTGDNNFSGSYLTTLPDRSRQADYTKTAQPDIYLSRLKHNLGNETLTTLKPIQWSEFETDLTYLESLVKRIKQRGGRVVFVRFPTDKGIWQIDQTRLPRAQYWDKLAAMTSAETIHFNDYPELSRYNLPDGSHLDYRDAVPFTDTLCKLIFKQPMQTAHQ